MTAVALRSRFFDREEGLGGNLLRVLSTVIVSSLVASIGFSQDAKSEKTVRHRSIESERKEAADAIDESFRSLRKFRRLYFIPQSRDFWIAHASSRPFWWVSILSSGG